MRSGTRRGVVVGGYNDFMSNEQKQSDGDGPHAVKALPERILEPTCSWCNWQLGGGNKTGAKFPRPGCVSHYYLLNTPLLARTSDP